MASIEGQASSMSSTGHKRKLKSDVWKHFVFLPSSVPGVAADEAMCRTCGNKLKAGGKKYGTTHLKRHIESNKCKAAAEEYLSDYFPNNVVNNEHA